MQHQPFLSTFQRYEVQYEIVQYTIGKILKQTAPNNAEYFANKWRREKKNQLQRKEWNPKGFFYSISLCLARLVPSHFVGWFFTSFMAVLDRNRPLLHYHSQNNFQRKLKKRDFVTIQQNSVKECGTFLDFNLKSLLIKYLKFWFYFFWFLQTNPIICNFCDALHFELERKKFFSKKRNLLHNCRHLTFKHFVYFDFKKMKFLNY